MTHIPSSHWLKRLHIGLATTLIALSAAMLLGLGANLDDLISWKNASAPIPTSAATGFILFGATLITIEFGNRRSALLAILPGAFGLFAALQNFLPSNFQWENGFTPDQLQPTTSASDRMPAALAICFIVGGLVILPIARRKLDRLNALSLAFGGSVMTAVGGLTLLGYVLGLPAVYRWGSETNLSPDIAVLLLLLGATLFILAWRENLPNQTGAPNWLPLPIIVIGATLTLTLWIGLREREAAYLGASTQIAMNGLASAINAEIERQSDALQRVASRWGQTSDLSPIVWETDVRMLLDEAPGCLAVTLLSADRHTRMLYPKIGYEHLATFDHNSDPTRRATLDAAIEKSGPSISASLDLQAADRGFAIYTPTTRGTRPPSFVGAEISYHKLLTAVDRKQHLAKNYRISIFVGTDLVFKTEPAGDCLERHQLESVFTLFDRRLRIEMNPSAENLRQTLRPLPELALVAGLGITLLLGLSVHLARKARTGLRTARQANLDLVAENEERRRIEERLKISDERLRLALDSTQIGIFEWNLPANQLYFSAGLWSMLGYPPGMIPNTPEAWTTLIHPDDLSAYKTIVERQLKGDDIFIEPEYRVRAANGQWRWLYARSRSVTRAANGTPRRIIGTVQDITSRKLAEQALRASQATTRKLSLVASKTDNLVIIAKPDGTIEWVNESFERVMEYPLAEIVNENPATFMVGPETKPRTIRYIQAAIKHGRGISTEIVNYSKSGKKYHLQLEIQPILNHAGVLENFIAIQADITARVETEQNLRRAKAEADAASRAKSEFLASMSHEIRTPMNGVIGMTSLLLDTKLNHDQRDFTSTIRSSGETLLTIINDILDFSKIESGKMDLEHQPFDLSICIEEALDLFSMPAATKKLELAYHIDDAVPAWIVGDVTRLRQILVNLVNNAVKFTPAGSISITATRISNPDTSPSVARPVTIEFAVTDTGIGIPADRMNRLFRPFSQVDSSTTRKYGGTGLGLAICHRLCSLMGGGISVTSVSGQGSTFKFTVQSESVPTPPGWGLPEMPVRLNYGPVLCLEDNPTSQRRLETFFRSWGARAICATTLAAVDEYLSGQTKPSAFVADQAIIHGPDEEILTTRLTQREIPILYLLPSAQSATHSPLEERKITAIAKPLRTLSLVRGMQAIFNATPASVPPFAYTPNKRLLAQEIPLDILLVEDNAVNQKVGLRFLDRLGYRADAVANGLEAINTLETRRYDLVLMDLQMPEMDGFEACRQIRKRLPLDEQPRIVALTANALQGDRELCLAAGMNDYIAKPVKLHEIADAIRRQFSGSRPPFRARP